jgi:phosphoenolpyruvate synthase/pyruvate phosphate dikinase
MTHAQRLDELGADDAPGYGGKSASLGELLRAGIPVPPGFALSTTAFDDFLTASGLAHRTASALAGLSAGDVDALARASHVIAEAMRSAPVPDAVREAVAARYGALAETGGEPPPVAVRSSALGEDSAEATFAGQQDTYLWVRGVDDICTAVRDCWTSLYNTQAISYRARLGGDAAARPAMGVTVQRMVDAAVSGVMFTCNPVTADPSMVAVNASWGLGLAVVGGEVTPDDFLVSKVTGEVVREHVHDKQIEYVPAPGGRGTVQVTVDAERRTAPCLTGAQLTALVELSRRVERHFGRHQDVEWAIDRAGTLYVLQSRPVTALPKRTPPPAPASALSLVMQKFGAGS